MKQQEIQEVTKIPSDPKIQKILKDEQIWESIRLIKKTKHGILIVTELKIVLYTNNLQRLWKQDCHHDPIINAKIQSNKLHITEFDGTRYTLDLETGKLVE